MKIEIKLYNSLSKTIENFEPLKENQVSVYSCGPTVYNYAHIGNMRAFLFADLLQKVLKIVGNYEVKWVMNITNIDDKTILNSRLNSTAWNNSMGGQTDDAMQNLLLLTRYYEQEFVKDIEKLGINKKDFFKMPRATEYVESMKKLIKLILDKRLAYISGGSIYFDVASYRTIETYGRLFKIDFDNFKSGSRVDTDQYEREQVSDFVLWKEHKENEPYWDFEIDGKNYIGRPGWHIECSAMGNEILSMPFDIHTGGVDLKFPHHEDEIAQSKAGYGIEQARFWCHNEFLEVEGEKMSKSSGNFFTLRDLEDKNISPKDIRFAMLSAHYRTKYNFTFAGIEASRKAKNRVQDYIYSIIEAFPRDISFCQNKSIITSKILKLKEEIYRELADDLHTPKALAHLFTFINNNKSNELVEKEQEEFLFLMYDLNLIFGAWEFEKKESVKEEIPMDIIELAERRLAAKGNKKFTEADELRNQIINLGYIIKDTKNGFEITST